MYTSHTSQYKHLQYSTESSWSCNECLWALNSLTFANVSNIEGELNVTDLSHDLDDSSRSHHAGNDKDSLISHRQAHPHLLFLAHLNINSLQSKFDELQLINNRLRAGILVLTETKIDSSYPDSQFKMANYRLYRQDRVKGGGGILTYISSKLPSKKLKITKTYKTIELLAVEVKLEGTCAVVLGIYRPPRSKGANYYQVLEEELNEITSWAISKCQTIIITGDLNLDRLKPNEREGKLLTDLEEVFELTCLIDQATRVTTTSSTLLDVILTNTPDLFKSAGVAEMGLSDHKLVYTFVNKVVKQHAARIINCRSTKHLDLEEFKKDLYDTGTRTHRYQSTSSIHIGRPSSRKSWTNISR